jgi:hypothetical protein
MLFMSYLHTTHQRSGVCRLLRHRRPQTGQQAA